MSVTGISNQLSALLLFMSDLLPEPVGRPVDRCMSGLFVRAMNRQARLFALAEHLRARRSGVTAETLAERYGVSVRTIYRDLDTLRDAALPVRADRGRGGGYALDKSYSLPPVALSAREAALLLRLRGPAATSPPLPV